MEFILKQCTSKVPGWENITPSNISVEELCGGLTNKLYKAWVSDRFPIKYDQVVVRFFGKDTDMFFERRTEFIVAESLSETGHGVKVFGTFTEYGGGRLEAFYRGRTLHCKDLREPEISVKIAAGMAKLHTLNIPLDKTQPRLFLNLTKWLRIARTLSVPTIKSSRSQQHFTMEQIGNEVQFLLRALPLVNSPILFCHNDLQEGNIIYDDDRALVQIIDYEYSAYNYRGFDLANHFCEHFIDYNVKQEPFFSLDPSKDPPHDHMIRFLNAYLHQYRSLMSAEGEGEDLSVGQTAEDLLREARWFMLGSHLMWVIWSVIQAVKSEEGYEPPSDIAFGYMEYAHARMVDYFRLKDQVKEKYPLAGVE
jgi:choline/ethanolamine kinase